MCKKNVCIKCNSIKKSDSDLCSKCKILNKEHRYYKCIDCKTNFVHQISRCLECLNKNPDVTRCLNCNDYKKTKKNKYCNKCVIVNRAENKRIKENIRQQKLINRQLKSDKTICKICRVNKVVKKKRCNECLLFFDINKMINEYDLTRLIKFVEKVSKRNGYCSLEEIFDMMEIYDSIGYYPNKYLNLKLNEKAMIVWKDFNVIYDNYKNNLSTTSVFSEI